MATPPSPQHTFACRWVTTGPSRIGRLLSWLSVALLITPLTVCCLLPGLYELAGFDAGGGLPLQAISAIFLSAGLAWLVVAVLIASSNRERITQPWGGLCVDEQGLTVEHLQVPPIGRDQIEEGLVYPTPYGPALELHLAGGRVLRTWLVEERDGYALLGLLGVGPDRRRVAVTLGNANLPQAASGLAYLAAMVGWGAVLHPIFRATLSGSWALWALLVLGTMLLARRAAGPTEVAIGAEGVRLRGPFRRRFLRFDGIAAVSGDGSRLVFQLHRERGARRAERVTVRSHDAGLAVGLADRIADAMALARHGGSEAVAELLSRGDRSLEAWRAGLGRLLQRGAQYRSAAIAEHDVLGVLEDPAARPALRIGAALALRESADPEARRRVRLAAAACADEETRAALEAAAAEQLDEAPIRRAVERRGE